MTSELLGPKTSQKQPEAWDPLSVPLLRQVAEADIAGFTAGPDDLQRPELAPARQNYKKLAEYGLSLYGTKDGRYAVFNSEALSPEEVQQYDAQGVLDKVLPPIDELPSDAGQPPMAVGRVESPAAQTPAQPAAAPQPAPVAPAPTGPIVRQRARAGALDTLSPTKRPNPGSGSVLQGLGRAVI